MPGWRRSTFTVPHEAKVAGDCYSMQPDAVSNSYRLCLLDPSCSLSHKQSAQQHARLTAAAAARKPQLRYFDDDGKVSHDKYDMIIELADNELRQVSSSH